MCSAVVCFCCALTHLALPELHCIAACTGRPLPSDSTAATPGALMTDELFNASIAWAETIWAYRALYNNSWWSKLAMGRPLWNIKTRMQDAADGGDSYLQLVVYAAHDTTVMPMLAAIFGDQWDGLWAGYASLLSFELYETPTPGQHLFRIIYNGNPLVVPGCGDTLCDMDVLMDVLSFAQEYMPCEAEPSAEPVDDSVLCDDSATSEAEWVETVVVASVCSWVAGMAGLYALFYFGLLTVHSRAAASARADAVLEDKSTLLESTVASDTRDNTITNQL
jgi:hypothetical protein